MSAVAPPSEASATPIALAARASGITAFSLGSAGLRAAYGLKLAYMSGSMYKGIASKEIVVAMGRAGLIGFLGTGGMSLEQIDADLAHIRRELPPGRPCGANLLAAIDQPAREAKLLELLFRHDVRHVEASAFMQPSEGIVHFRLKGAVRAANGSVAPARRVMAKVSRPEVAEMFMAPPPPALVRRLVETGSLSEAEAALAPHIPLAGEICVEADSAGHTDQGVASVLLPAMLRLRDQAHAKHGYATPLYVGAAGGIGTPEAAAAAFVLGADFVLTGSINQCTVESGMSERVKDMLQTAQVQDMAYAPAGDLFELGSRIQVLRKGVLFPARANKLYELYTRHASIDEIDAKTRDQIETRYFKRSFDDVWAQAKSYQLESGRKTEAELEGNAKQKMALIFRWYFAHSTRLAFEGNPENTVDYQVHCGPAMGAFNQWVQGTDIESWRNRRVAEIGERLMAATAQVLNDRYRRLAAG